MESCAAFLREELFHGPHYSKIGLNRKSLFYCAFYGKMLKLSQLDYAEQRH